MSSAQNHDKWGSIVEVAGNEVNEKEKREEANCRPD